MPKPSQDKFAEIFLSQIQLADAVGRLTAQLRKWEATGIVVKAVKGYPLHENSRRIIDHLCSSSQQKAVTTAEKTAEQVRNLKLDAEAKERTRKKDEGEWIELIKVKEAVAEHVGSIRQTFKDLVLLEQPATLSGRSESDIRTLNTERWEELNRTLRNEAGKIS